MQETQVQSLGQEESLKKEMATSSSILAWEISGTEEPGRLQSMGLQRVKHNLVIKQQQHLVRLFWIFMCITSDVRVCLHVSIAPALYILQE